MGGTSYPKAGKDRPTAVIVGLEANGLGVARALARYSIPCIALAGPFWNPCYRTNACSVVRGSDWTAEALVRDLRTIGGRLQQKAPLLLTKDQAVLWVSEAREELSEFFEIALPDKATVNLLMSKVEFVELARARGWPVPKTWTIETRDALVSRLPEFVYPCILKPRFKNDDFRLHSPQKAFRVTSREELLKAYDLVAAWEKEVVIQEWIDGTDERIAFCLGYCDRESNPRALFAGRKLIQWPVGWGNTAVSEPAPREWADPIVALTREIWKTVGYKGLGSIEYKMRRDSNTPVLIEPTVGRTDFQSELAVLNGVNIPATAYFDLARLPLPEAEELPPVTKLVNGPAHWRAAKVFMSQPQELGISKWMRARSGRKRYMILRVNDFRPFLSSIYARVRGATGDWLERLVGTELKRKLAARLTR